ncbi:hypothetical protein BH09MYX1_BH09MYX1_12100 [soil metagenome]
MRSSSILLSLTVLALVACGSSSSTQDGDPTALTEPLATGITISEIAMFQALKVPLAKDGAVADPGSIPLPIVAGRDGLMRIYVTPDAGFAPKSITARVKIVNTSPTGGFTKVVSATMNVTATPSEEFDLGTTINVNVPGAYLQPGSTYTVVLNAAGGSAASGTSPARFPKDGSFADLPAKQGGERLRVMIVPVQYGADGSDRLPDTSDEQLKRYRDLFFKLYPTALVELTVREPWAWGGTISPSGQGMDQALNALGKLRQQDLPDPDVYYYGAFAPSDSFGSYCGGGCVTGLSPIGMPYSVGVGFTGGGSVETATHEVGHAHGLSHAPCGGAGGPDPQYPTDTLHAQGKIGVWGYDPIALKLINPTPAAQQATPHDVMGYCNNDWISDFHYDKLYRQLRSDNRFYASDFSGERRSATEYLSVAVDGRGSTTVSDLRSHELFIERGEPRPITWEAAANGATAGQGTAYFFPYDHLPGGVLWTPPAPPGAVSARAGVGVSAVRIALRPGRVRIYLDWNATTPPLAAAEDAMREARATAWANPSSIHADGRAAAKWVEDARSAVGELAGADVRDVVFTAGGTEANNLALRSALARPGRLLLSKMEHPSITRIAEAHLDRVRWLAVLESGVVDLADLERALAEGPTAAVTLQSVNHESGLIPPVADAIALVNVRAPGTWFHVDAVQSFAKIDDPSFGATSRSLAAHKFRGPKGIGALVVLPRTKLLPVLLGGAQERGIRPGTLDAVVAAGLYAAARHAMTGPERYRAVAPLRDRLERELRALGASVNGTGPRAPHVTNVYIPSWYGPELVAALDLEGVSAASGSACSAGTLDPSPVIEAMHDRKRAARSVRLSLGETTTEAEIARAIAIFADILGRP